MKSLTMKKKYLNIQTYDYEYHRSDFLLTLVAFVGSVILICFLHRLSWTYSLIVLGTMVLLLPWMITSYYTYKHEKQRFEDYCKYFEYMKIYFKTYKKIKLALENVRVLFPETSTMYTCIEEAITQINRSGDYEKALSIIDKKYHNSYLERLHNLLITGEEHGSDSVYENLDLIHYEAWKDDITLHQNRKKTFRYMLYGMTIFALGLSYYGVQMFADAIDGIFQDQKYQMYTFINLECIVILFVSIYISFVNKKWVRSDD